MKKRLYAVVLIFLTGVAIGPAALAQVPGTPGAGRGGAQNGLPPGSASVRASGSNLGMIRLGAADDKIWFGWRVGIPAGAFRQLTFVEAAAKADALSLASIEGFSTQRVSPEIPKKLDYHLAAGERSAIMGRLRELNVAMPAYHVDSIDGDESSSRKLFEFAKSMGVATIVSAHATNALPAVNKLAEEYGINVAVCGNPDSVLAAEAGLGKRVGVCADLGAWMQEGIKPADGVRQVKERLMIVNLRDRSAFGEKGRDVALGSGAAGLPDFFLQAFRLEIKPLIFTVDSTGAADTFADLSRSLDGFDKAIQPAMKARVAQVADSPQGAIRGPDRLPLEVRQQIDAAAPRQALAKPKKPRKLLVVDLQMYSGHGTIPHGNLLLELMGKYTGAFEPTFSNDLNNLKYPKIKEFDAVFLNSVVGMVFPDPEVREGLLRFVREGGGLGGIHGTTYAALDWPEFTDMLGGGSGEHHTERQFLKIDDPGSPLNAAFGGQSFEHTDEFYHFPASSPYSRQKSHVLLSIDVEKSDMATSGRLCAKCTRPDQDYAMSWIKTYGKGRVFCTPLGHTPILFTTPAWTKHILGGIQFILGDLELDATPSARLAANKLAAKKQK